MSHTKYVNDSIKVSVIIPVYNTSMYLEKCLDSVINQTLKEIEIICIDDGSVDTSLDILNKYAQNDTRIKIIHQKNSGVSVARNKGIKFARGEYIEFVDSDDYLALDCIERAYKKIKQTNTDILMFLQQEVPACEGKGIVHLNQALFHNLEITNNGFIIDDNDKMTLMDSACDKLYSREFIQKNGILFIENIHATEDGVFNILCWYYNASISIMDYIGYNRVDTGKSVTSNLKTIIHKAIYTVKYVMEMNLYKSFSDDFKIIVLNKLFGSILYYYRQVKTIVLRLYYVNIIQSFLKYVQKKEDITILEKVENYHSLKQINIRRLALNRISKIRNKFM